MNRIFVLPALLVGFFAAFGAAPAHAQAAPRVAYVNSQVLGTQAPGVADAEAEFQRRMQPLQTELEGLEQELDTLQVTFERQQATMPAATRQARLQEIQQKLAAYQQRGQEIQQQAQQVRMELFQPLQEKILTAVETFRAAQNYGMILDAAAGALMAADPALDVTQQVLDHMATANP